MITSLTVDKRRSRQNPWLVQYHPVVRNKRVQFCPTPAPILFPVLVFVVLATKVLDHFPAT